MSSVREAGASHRATEAKEATKASKDALHTRTPRAPGLQSSWQDWLRHRAWRGLREGEARCEEREQEACDLSTTSPLLNSAAAGEGCQVMQDMGIPHQEEDACSALARRACELRESARCVLQWCHVPPFSSRRFDASLILLAVYPHLSVFDAHNCRETKRSYAADMPAHLAHLQLCTSPPRACGSPQGRRLQKPELRSIGIVERATIDEMRAPRAPGLRQKRRGASRPS